MQFRLLVFLSPLLGWVLTPTAVACPTVASDCPWAEPHRVIAVGDVHGSVEGLMRVLEDTGLVDSNGAWIGGDALLVQTGDMIDRGGDDRQVMDLLIRLQKEAASQGGRVEVLLGNHEVMNIMGDLRYVSPEAFSRFTDGKSLQRREAAFRQYAKFQKRRARQRNQPEPVITDQEKEEWLQRHPPGFIEHRRAFDPGGRYGKWLRQLPALFEVSGTLFLHGGLHPSLEMEAGQINQTISRELQLFDHIKSYMVSKKLILPFFDLEEMTGAAAAEVEALRRAAAAEQRELSTEEEKHVEILETLLNLYGWLSVHPDGPLWFRGFAGWSEEEGRVWIEQLSQARGVCRFVVGHTPQLPRSIAMRFDGRVFLIDTGMLSDFYEGGGPAALEIDQGRFSAVYPGQRTLLLEAPSPQWQYGDQTSMPGR